MSLYFSHNMSRVKGLFAKKNTRVFATSVFSKELLGSWHTVRKNQNTHDVLILVMITLNHINLEAHHN